jgi:hypothetical protein
MKLEQSTRLILAAVDFEDLGALQAACKEREAAIIAIDSAPATAELQSAVVASLKAGEEAKRAIRMLKQRFRNESRRLERIETGFVKALRPAALHRINCQG